MTDQPGPLAALGDSADGLCLADEEQRIVRWNAGAERLLGYTSSEVLRRKCYDVIAGTLPGGRPLCKPRCSIRTCVERGRLPPGVTCDARAKDGRQVRLRIHTLVIPHDRAPLVAHLLHAMTRDVNDDAERARDAVSSSTCGELSLTPRERQVLRLVADGLSNKRIAVRLRLSAFTVRNHVQHILTKSGAHNRAEVVSFAFRGRVF